MYEAGYFGFWLHDRVVSYGANCIVTSPSLLPQEYGNRVKTDRRGSRKLAHLLAKGMLKRVWVPTLQERYHRDASQADVELSRGRRVKEESLICQAVFLVLLCCLRFMAASLPLMHIP